MAYGSVKIDSITTSTKTVAIDNLSVNGYINNASIAIDAAIAFSKLQNVSAADKILGRGSSGAGAIEEITCTAAGRALLDDADAAAQRNTLGLGTLATQSGTFSGTSSGTNTGDQTIQLTGDVTGSGTGTFAATIANDSVTYAKIQNVSATDKLLGRSTAGSGDVEEITCTAAGRALLDDVDATAQRTTLGLGSLATANSISNSNVASNAGIAGSKIDPDFGAQNIKTTGTLAVGQATAAANTDFDLNGTYAGNVVAIGALDVDCSSGNYFTKTINGNSTFTFSNVPASRAYGFTLELTHASGTVTWPATVKWPNDTAPSLTTGKTHLFVFVTDDGGSRWRGAAQINYVN